MSTVNPGLPTTVHPGLSSAVPKRHSSKQLRSPKAEAKLSVTARLKSCPSLNLFHGIFRGTGGPAFPISVLPSTDLAIHFLQS